MTSTSLKLIALLLMFIDHIAEFIPNIPVWFHWLGRLSAPIFIFCMAWGFKYTHDRKIYVIRMYVFSVGMAAIDFIFNNLYRDRAYFYILNNIFSTLFLIAVIVWILEIKQKDNKRANKLIVGFVLLQVVSFFACSLGSELLKNVFPKLFGFEALIGAITGNIFTAEGGIIFVALGVLIYFYKDTKKRITVAYGMACIIYFAISLGAGISYEMLFNYNYQWMMIFSLPFMLMYNGQKGKGLKYLFYIFYPAHIIILFLIGNAMISL